MSLPRANQDLSELVDEAFATQPRALEQVSRGRRVSKECPCGPTALIQAEFVVANASKR